MRTAASRLGALALALFGVSQGACLVHVTKVADAGPLFREARAEAVRFGEHTGPARELNVLAWDPKDRELVRVSVPLWLIRSAERRIDWNDVELDPEHERWRKRVGRLRIEDIERAGPGILLEVLEDEGDRVLVWLR